MHDSCLPASLLPPTSNVARQPRRGFTLLELALVLAIVAVVAAIAIPPVARAFKNEKLRKAGKLIRNEFAKARIQAMESGVTYEFKYVVGGSSFQVNPRASLQDALEMSSEAMDGDLQGSTPADVNPFAPTSQMMAQQTSEGIPPKGQLVQGVKFVGGDMEVDARAQVFEQAAQVSGSGSTTGVDLAASVTTGEWSTPILFYPDGTTSDAQLILGNERARYVILRLRSLTGMCRVSDLLLADEVPQ